MAAKDVVDILTRPRPSDKEVVEDIQVIVNMKGASQSIRKIKSSNVSQMVKVSGIVVASSQVRSRATKVTFQCRTCRHVISDFKVAPGLEGFQLPRTCQGSQVGSNQKCPMDPYHILPDKSSCVDFQTLKLQENPEDVPQGEMPRHMQLYVDRYLTDLITPGNRVSATGIFSIKKLFNKAVRVFL